MTKDEKIRIGMVALSVVASAVLAVHFGHAHLKPPFLDEVGGGLGSG